jgi:hypothetical protein
MATSTLTLYSDTTNTEQFDLSGTEGKTTQWVGASSTPSLPVSFDFTRDAKAIGNMSNDRYYYSVKRSATATAQAAVRTSSATLQVSTAKDPSSGATLLVDAQAALVELISYVTGAAPTATTVANCAKLVAGQAL